MAAPPASLRWLGRVDYEPTWHAMRAHCEQRAGTEPDQLWFLEHPPVFTLGMNAREEHLLAPGEIPVVKVDRGGEVTYHGPGQLVVYPLLDLERLGLGVRALVEGIERAVVETLAEWGITASGRRDAPGVYVEGSKIASIVLRIRRSCSYHGLSLNVAMDLEPFSRINPCGFAGLAMTQVRDLGGPAGTREVARALAPRLLAALALEPAEAADDWLPGDRQSATSTCRQDVSSM